MTEEKVKTTLEDLLSDAMDGYDFTYTVKSADLEKKTVLVEFEYFEVEDEEEPQFISY